MAIAFARTRYLSRATCGNAVRSATYNARETITAEVAGRWGGSKRGNSPVGGLDA